MGANDCLPPGVEVSGRVAKLTFGSLGNAKFEQSTLYIVYLVYSIYRGSKPVSQKLTGMAVSRLKDYTGGKKHST